MTIGYSKLELIVRAGSKIIRCAIHYLGQMQTPSVERHLVHAAVRMIKEGATYNS